MINAFLVGAGGFAGSVLRYWASGLCFRLFGPAFPFGTLFVNVIGCLLIGVVDFLVEERQAIPAQVRLLVMTGFLGGFTTFSTFGNETMALVRGGSYRLALYNVVASVALGLGAVVIGRAMAKVVFGAE